jgi:hypothetical protein
VTGASQILPVLHVGFHKCGSTTLQAALLNRHPQIDYLGEPREEPLSTEAIRLVRDSCYVQDRKRIPFDLARSRALWQEALSAIAPGKVPVFSKESLTQPEFYATPDDRRLPERLHAAVGPSRIVIVTRHQIRLIESLYLFHAKGVHVESAQQWLDARRDDLRQYRFHTVAESFAAVFGRDNVAVFPFEDLKADAKGFARRVCEFIGVDPEKGAELISGERRNQRVSARYLMYSKLRKALGLYVPVGRMVPEPMRRKFNDVVAGGREARVELPAPFVATMEDYFREDNRRLSSDWGIPVEKYGYPV